MSSSFDILFTVIQAFFGSIYDVFKDNGILELAKGLKTLAGMWK
ncbi:hypothetical protein [Corynebacterium diphtheriae]|nr:hypothetical protein [Corynebacterium diphtheriae]AEX42675.1 hypothetical protein CD31A_2008 [Corynebacterium diphtheriae 31A]CAB0661355.1 hypothetical protein FRC0016_01844 [Corynebacterium diphtheriae]CAB0663871.1 hypothetical protein CIP107563_01958 [Corynebacterium diphtheriae]CAB0759692.1 hypothetical protein FRC0132_01893 [Corynebacterium diphtheriae]CAB0811121.1 hypothetical protein FRC0213_01848 [Corynebacterium diphtheriae]